VALSRSAFARAVRGPLAFALFIAVAAFARDSRERNARVDGAVRVRDGAALVRQLGCAVCHADLPPAASSPVAAPLDATTLTPDSVLAVLRAPVQRPAAAPRMPSFHLDEREALALALYIGQGDTQGEARRLARRHSSITAADGARIFDALNCAGCHAHADHVPHSAGPALTFERVRVQATWLRAFLRDPHAVRPFGTRPGSGARMPDFALSADEADSIATFLVGRDVAQLDPFEPRPLSRFARARLDTLLARRWSCLGCHTWNGVGGRIGPDLGLAAQRLQPSFVRAILNDPRHVVPGTIMPQPRMTDDVLDEIASRLVAGEQSGAAQVATTDTATGGYLSLIDHATISLPTASPASAAALYAMRCAGCHGADGRGDGYNAAFLRVPPLAHTDSAALSLRPDDTVFDAIAAGGFILGRSPEMPAFADLNADEVRALVAFVRSLCRCVQPAWAGPPRSP
jgi:mono/diheme cytochrome c family protein